jgi:glutathione peroxidase-family protein
LLATWKEKAGNGVRKGKELEKLGRRWEHEGFLVFYFFDNQFIQNTDSNTLHPVTQHMAHSFT